MNGHGNEDAPSPPSSEPMSLGYYDQFERAFPLPYASETTTGYLRALHLALGVAAVSRHAKSECPTERRPLWSRA